MSRLGLEAVLADDQPLVAVVEEVECLHEKFESYFVADMKITAKARIGRAVRWSNR